MSKLFCFIFFFSFDRATDLKMAISRKLNDQLVIEQRIRNQRAKFNYPANQGSPQGAPLGLPLRSANAPREAPNGVPKEHIRRRKQHVQNI